MCVCVCVYPTIRLLKCLSVTLVVILVLVYWMLVVMCNNDFALCVIAVFVMLKKSLSFTKTLFVVFVMLNKSLSFTKTLFAVFVMLKKSLSFTKTLFAITSSVLVTVKIL